MIRDSNKIESEDDQKFSPPRQFQTINNSSDRWILLVWLDWSG